MLNAREITTNLHSPFIIFKAQLFAIKIFLLYLLIRYL